MYCSCNVIFLHKKAGYASFFMLFLFALTFSSCENDIEKVSLVTGKSKLPIESSTDMEILYSDSAKVRVKVNTAVMNRFDGENPYTELPKGVSVKFFDENLNVTSTLTSKYAIRKDNENIMEAKNDVVVVNEKGEKLNTEHLIWNERTHKIYSDKFVKITTPDKILFGNGFEANQDFTNYKIFNIKGTITIDKDEHTPNP
ncbi:MAG: LPS export ABC transporter periplasmic protein LptC [Bacteroidetes bacterium]|nr:LPS export ABC transporter periplasmic protein LptC [Bacteroidota bacterium]